MSAGALGCRLFCKRGRSGLDKIEPALDALKAAVDTVDAARDTGVLRLEKPKPFLYLDHRSFQVGNIAADSSKMFEDQIGALV